MKLAMVTGASSGLGVSFVNEIDRHEEEIDEIWLIARREDRLQDVARSCQKPCRIFAMDLSQMDGFTALERSLQDVQPDLRLLINNAGRGVSGNFEDQDWADAAAVCDLNMRAVVAMTSIASPYLSRASRVINVASVAAFLPQPHFAVYAASKSFVLSLSRALNEAWRKRGVHVLACCPNPMETEFFDNDSPKTLVAKIKRIGLEQPDAVARYALKQSARGKAVAVWSWPARLIRLVSRLLPQGLSLRIMGLLGF